MTTTVRKIQATMPIATSGTGEAAPQQEQGEEDGEAGGRHPERHRGGDRPRQQAAVVAALERPGEVVPRWLGSAPPSGPGLVDAENETSAPSTSPSTNLTPRVVRDGSVAPRPSSSASTIARASSTGRGE